MDRTELLIIAGAFSVVGVAIGVAYWLGGGDAVGAMLLGAGITFILSK